VALHKRLAMAGGRLTLDHVGPTVREILHITQLDQVFDTRPAG
jgi:anti-anti-sigma regulatory factor